jgi:hypothetical protein
MRPFWIESLQPGERLIQSNPTPMDTASFDRASGSLLRKEAKPDHDGKE